MRQNTNINYQGITAAELKTGQNACISSLGKGRGFRARMIGLGVRPGLSMKIISANRRGPMIIEVGRNRIMLGREMLNGIILKGTIENE